MSDFNLDELLPFYLDETDEQIGVLNDALLRLENDPAEAQALQEAFRIAHSIKGASRLMGYQDVETLTHHLESYFDQLRAGQRRLDRPSLDVCFACLDALREFHRQLRSEGSSAHDLSASIKAIVRCVENEGEPDEPAAAEPIAEDLDDPTEEPAQAEQAQEPSVAAVSDHPTGGDQRIRLELQFESSLQWRDMKARLVLNRLAERVRVLGSIPPAESLEQLEDMPLLTIWVAADIGLDELRALADVDGVSEIQVEMEVSADSSNEDGRVAEAEEREVTQAEPVKVAEPVADRSKPEPERTAPASSPAASAPEPASPSRPAAPRKGRIGETLRVDVDRLDHLMNLAGELVINKARFGQIMSGLKELYSGGDAQTLANDTRDRLETFIRGLEHAEKAGPEASHAVSRCRDQFKHLNENVTTILDQLEQMRQGQEKLQSMTEAMDQLARIADGIQKGVLDTRMVPIGPLFERFRRVVRDLSGTSAKQVDLRLAGEATELDKRMIDELADPLVHMIRNAVDHGLEDPETRVKLGKPAAGRVSLQAAHRGNSVVITVVDDGRGIDPERVRRKIVAQGLASELESRAMSDRQLISYIWHAGLSTAEEVTGISGRGVGMDIVKSHIENLSGSVDVRTELGKGTTFTIRLPLTLAILPSLVVRIYDEYYAIPLDAADEIIEVRPRDVRRVHGTATIDNRGKILALIELNDVFRWARDDHPSFAKSAAALRPDGEGRWTVVLVQNGETTTGIRVDELVGIQEVVLKSLERHFRPVPGLSGASILGDGRVSLILDIDAVIGMANNGPRTDRKGQSRLLAAAH